jgi:hypothetical protein
MKTAVIGLTSIFIISGPCWAQENVGARDSVTVLDMTAGGRMFDQWFVRFGYRPFRTVALEGFGTKLQLPAVKEEAMIGFSSAFSLAGNFEVQADLEIISLPLPTAGYGPSIGITVDAEAPDGSIGLTRGLSMSGKSQFAVVRVIPSANIGQDPKLEADVFPASGSRARLVLRREKSEIVCLASDRPGEEPQEIKRVTFNDQRVRHLRLHACNGGSPTPVVAKLSGILIHADEIVGGMTRTELDAEQSYWWWWMPVAAIAFVAAWAVRRHKRRLAD